MACCINKSPKSSLKDSPTTPTTAATTTASKHLFFSSDSPSLNFLNLHSITELSHDTKKFRFALSPDSEPSSSMKLNLPIGGHFLINFKNPGYVPNLDPNTGENPATGDVPEWNGEEDYEADMEYLTRPYTPVSNSDELIGFVDLVIKIYRKNEEYKDGGRCSRFLDNLKIGTKIEVDGPYGKVRYNDLNGEFLIGYAPNQTTKNPKHIMLIAGGSGITPCYQVLYAAIKRNINKSNLEQTFSLIYSNHTEDDILLKDELENLVVYTQSQTEKNSESDAETSKSKLRLHFTVTSKKCNGVPAKISSYEELKNKNAITSGTGRLSLENVKEMMSLTKGVSVDETLALLCGPRGMMRAAREHLETIGIQDVVEF